MAAVTIGLAFEELRPAAAPDALERLLGSVVDLEHVHAVDFLRRNVVGGNALVELGTAEWRWISVPVA